MTAAGMTRTVRLAAAAGLALAGALPTAAQNVGLEGTGYTTAAAGQEGGPSWVVQGTAYFNRLGGAYAVCQQLVGAQQSPVNLPLPGDPAPRMPAVTYPLDTMPPQRLEILKNDHTVEIKGFTHAGDRTSSPALQQLGEVWRLASIHFHHPSEHLLNGVRYPMEMHLVHELVGDPVRKAVVGKFLQIVPESDRRVTQISLLREVFTAMALADPARKAAPGEELKLGEIEIEANEARARFKDLVPTPRRPVIRYGGSLTTPPCSPVTWFVAPADEDRLGVTAAEVAAFKRHFPMDSRPVQGVKGPAQNTFVTTRVD